MNTLFQNVETFIVVALGAGYLYGQFFSGKNQASADKVSSEKEVIELRQSQINELRDLCSSLRDELEKTKDQHNFEMRDLSNKYAELKGQLSETENQKKEYLEILQNRNPELEAILGEINTSMKNVTDFMKLINLHLTANSTDK